MQENNFWDDDLDDADRDKIDWVWREKVRNDQREIEKGVRRMDCLGCCIFEESTRKRTCSTCLFLVSCIFMFLFHRRGHCIINVL